MRILDIGGGFAGGSFDAAGTVQLGQVPLAVNTALATFFPDPSVKVTTPSSFAMILCNFFLSVDKFHSCKQMCACVKAELNL